MYYLKTIVDRVRVPPSMFGSAMEEAVLRILRERYEGRIFRDLGVVLSVDNPHINSEGTVIPGDGGAYYSVEFEALSFLPAVNEVYLADVKEIVEFGAFASIGPFQGLLHVSQIGKDKYSYDKKTKVLSARGQGKAIKKSDSLLVKVSTVSLKANSSDTKIGLTMRPEGLGKLEWLAKPEAKKEAKKKAEKGKKGEEK